MKSIEILEMIVERCGVRANVFYFEGCYETPEEMVRYIWGDNAMCRVNNALKGEKVLVMHNPLVRLSDKAPSPDVIVAVFENEEVSVRYIYNLID